VAKTREESVHLARIEAYATNQGLDFNRLVGTCSLRLLKQIVFAVSTPRRGELPEFVSKWRRTLQARNYAEATKRKMKFELNDMRAKCKAVKHENDFLGQHIGGTTEPTSIVVKAKKGSRVKSVKAMPIRMAQVLPRGSHDRVLPSDEIAKARIEASAAKLGISSDQFVETSALRDLKQTVFGVGVRGFLPEFVSKWRRRMSYCKYAAKERVNDKSELETLRAKYKAALLENTVLKQENAVDCQKGGTSIDRQAFIGDRTMSSSAKRQRFV
jgi:hypothetical protein